MIFTCIMPWNTDEEKTLLIQKYKLTDRLLQRKCSEDHMHNIAAFISWSEVGYYLCNIEGQDIEDIDKDCRSQQQKRWKLLNKWEEGNGDDATYDALITAMLRARKRSEATDVCKLLLR